MTTENLSYLAMVTATVFYIGAFLCCALEWAYAKGLPAKPIKGDRRDEDARLRVDAQGRMGLLLTIAGTAAALVGVVTRGVAAHRFPWGNMYEFVTSAMLFVAIAYLIGVWKANLRWLGIGVTALLAIGNGLAVTVFFVRVAPLVPALHSVWFVLHIVAACLAAAAFNLGAVASVLYLLRSRAEQRIATAQADAQAAESGDLDDEPIEGSGGVAAATKVATAPAVAPALTGFLARIPSTQTMDTLAYRAIAFGFPVWTFTVAAGSVWAEYAWGRYWGWDPKETWALITWVIYAGYLHARATAGWRGRRAAIIALVGVASFWFNFIGINLLVSGLHSYAGI